MDPLPSAAQFRRGVLVSCLALSPFALSDAARAEGEDRAGKILQTGADRLEKRDFVVARPAGPAAAPVPSKAWTRASTPS